MRLVFVSTLVALCLFSFVGMVSLMPAEAGTGYIKPSVPNAVNTPENIKNNLLCKGMFWIFTIALILGVIFLLWAGIKYITSGGNKETFSEANRMLIFAIVGIAVAILARGVPYIVGDIVGATPGDPCQGVT